MGRGGSRQVDDGIDLFEFADGRQIILIANGRMLNLAGREPKGNSIESMDVGFMLQALSLARVAQAPPGSLITGPQPVPADINREIALSLLAKLAPGQLSELKFLSTTPNPGADRPQSS